MANRFLRLIKIFTGTDSGGDGELLQLEGRLERFAHFWTLVARHFVRNRCLIRASALAYTTLLALIPLLAVVISISTGLLKNVDEDKFYSAIASVAPCKRRRSAAWRGRRQRTQAGPASPQHAAMLSCATAAGRLTAA